MKHVGLKLVLVLLLLAALAVVGWRSFQPASSTTIRFPNGTIVRYLGAARGGTEFNTGKPWLRPARRVLPAQWRNWVPPEFKTTASGSSNKVTFYWDVIDLTGKAAGAWRPWSELAVLGDDGSCIERTSDYSSSWVGGGSVRSVFGVRPWVFPRRQADFLVQFLDTAGAVVGSVRLPNPIQGQFPDWTPDSLPITRTNPPLVLTLAGLNEFIGPGQRHYLQPDWRITSTDLLWTSARVGYFQCEDATGNEGSFLSLKEPAWKIRTWVHRQRSVDFTDNERLILTNLSIPNPGELQSLDVTAVRAGVKLIVQCLAGAGTLYVTNGTNRIMTAVPSGSTGRSSTSDGKTTVTTLGSPTPFLLVEAVGVKPQDDIRFRALDEQGREVKLDSSSGSYGSGQSDAWTYKRGITPTDGVKTISLEIIVSRPREFEFTINPAEIKRAQPATK